MESIIAFFMIGFILAIFVVGAVALHKLFKKKKKEEEEMLAARKKQIEEYWSKQRSEQFSLTDTYTGKYDKYKLTAKEEKQRSKPVTTTTSYSAPTPSYSAPVQTSSDDGFVNGLILGAVVDNLLHSSPSVDRTEERSVGVSKTESSWGFDDSDSRKSISDSMSSSWSSSSSSSDSWSSSSSDSGPSSDW